MKYIVVDLEMNPIGKEYVEEKKICRSEIIEIGAVVLDENLHVVAEFKTLVKPQFNDRIYKKYETLTGITTQMVEGAPAFKTAYKMFITWCESFDDDYEIYAWSENDYNQILKEMELKDYEITTLENKAFSNWYDFQREYSNKLGVERIMSLDKALNYAGVTFVGRQHDALYDAKNTAELFAIVRDEERCNKALKYVMEAFRPKNISGTLGDMFDFGDLLGVSA